MWWYRDRKDKQAGDGDEVVGPQSAVAKALVGALSGHPPVPDCLIAMAVIVDSRIELTDGEILEHTSWADAERFVEEAVGGESLRLYNVFAKDYGDGATRRDDLTPEQAAAIERVRGALAASDEIKSVAPLA